ncbi:MAG: hypothetical protein FJ102_23375 [Deltaproteobacteria bacterium]|nr:hypothetical protein [Deltaproteobacteria bacterium]
MILALLLGCADFFAIADTLEDLTNPMVVQAWYIGVEPLPAGMDLGDSGWGAGSSARVMLADASSLEQLEDSPIDDAAVELEVEGEGFALLPESAGNFAATSEDGLPWAPAADTVLRVDRDGTHHLAMVTPGAPSIDLPESIEAGDGLGVSLEGQDYDNVMVTVVRLADGQTTYDSLPTDIAELYRLTHAAGSLEVEIPGSAFREPGAYAVGVAGLVNADPDDYEGVNIALSALTAGSLRFVPMQVE